MMIDFKIKEKDRIIIDKIVDRIQKKNLQGGENKTILTMDLIATHQGENLNLNRLYKSIRFNFWHDIHGIIDNLDRDTGKLLNEFVPRCQRPS